MASNASSDDSCGEMLKLNCKSGDGVVRCKWKPRNISAIRDFPKASDQSPVPTTLSDVESPFSVNSSKSTSNDDTEEEPHKFELIEVKPMYYVEQLRDLNNTQSEETEVSSMSSVHFQTGVSGDYVGPGETNSDSKTSSTNIGIPPSANELNDKSVPFEMDIMSGESSTHREIHGSGHQCEEIDMVVSVSTDKVKHYRERRVSAVRCFPPGCGENARHLSEEELEAAFSESKNHYLTCKTCTADEYEEEIGLYDGITDVKGVEIKDEKHRGVVIALYAESRCPWRNCKRPLNLRTAPNEDSISVGSLQKFSNNIETSEINRRFQRSSTSIETKEDTNAYQELHYHRRRVSAVRCFPPGCGIDAAPLSPKGLEEAIAESKKHFLTCKTCGIEGEEFEDVNTRIKRARTEHKGEHRHRVVVQALAAAPNCPWRNSRQARYQQE